MGWHLFVSGLLGTWFYRRLRLCPGSASLASGHTRCGPDASLPNLVPSAISLFAGYGRVPYRVVRRSPLWCAHLPSWPCCRQRSECTPQLSPCSPFSSAHTRMACSVTPGTLDQERECADTRTARSLATRRRSLRTARRQGPVEACALRLSAKSQRMPAGARQGGARLTSHSTSQATWAHTQGQERKLYLLGRGEDRVGEVVEAEAGGDGEGEVAEHEGQDVDEHFLRRRVLLVRVYRRDDEA